jgi:hypothetical protein
MGPILRAALIRSAFGPYPTLARALDAAPQLHQTGHSRIAQQFFG